jgi:hypothetical protein
MSWSQVLKIVSHMVHVWWSEVAIVFIEYIYSSIIILCLFNMPKFSLLCFPYQSACLKKSMVFTTLKMLNMSVLLGAFNKLRIIVSSEYSSFVYSIILHSVFVSILHSAFESILHSVFVSIRHSVFASILHSVFESMFCCSFGLNHCLFEYNITLSLFILVRHIFLYYQRILLNWIKGF